MSKQWRLHDIVDGVGDARGRIFILEGSTGRVAIADRGLQLLGYLGQLGAQRGQFSEPVKLGIFPDGRLAVLDRGLRRITIFVVGEGGRPSRVDHVIGLTSPGESMCVLNDKTLLVYGHSDGRRLHVIDMQGRSLRSFAPGDPARSLKAQDLTTTGRIACDLARDEVLVTSDMTPIVEAYRISTGDSVWKDVLRPVRSLRLVDEGGRVSIQSRPAGYSRVSSASTVNGYRILQTTYDSRIDGSSRDTVVTFVYSVREHGWAAPTVSLPLVYPLHERDVIFAASTAGNGVVERSQLVVAGSRQTADSARRQ